MKTWSAWIPVTMSIAALGTVATHIAIYGAARETDEGAAAHIWQLLMAAQAPVMLYFLIRWLPRSPRRALPVMAIQICAALAAIAPVYYLRL